MAQDSIIAWNPANWVTVLLMVAVGFFAIGMIARIVQARRGAAGG
jgi:hypothetical protein